VADVAIASPPSTSVLLQSTLSLTAWALDAGGARLADQTITWASDRPDVVSVTSTGRHPATVTGLGTGAAVITATSGRASDAVTISVRLTPVASLAITNPPQQSLDAGGGLRLTAVATDAAGNVLTGVDVRWSSSDTNAATVESTGATTAAVTGRTPGTVRITAAADSQTAIIALTVRPAPPVSVRFDPNPQDIVLPTGQTTRESAVVIDLLGNSVVRPTTWSSSDEAVATVDPVKGTSTTILAKAAGTAVIMASADGISGSITIHVPPAHHAFLWTAGNGMVDLGTLPGFTISEQL
jgi:probable HAF family extracellular repeat protein